LSIRTCCAIQLPKDAYAAEWKSYTGRERVLLRKRRAKLRLQNFHIITQVGQGGYGEVYLARKKDTQEVVALKKMKKSTLAKMDEIKHVLVERDILTATKTPWLVALLYAFQDPSHIFLAMVRFYFHVTLCRVCVRKLNRDLHHHRNTSLVVISELY
jgi:cell cycle protein kinase DBF2